MKKILLIALLLTPCLGFSQTTKPIDGFLGIKFGSTKLAVIAAMKAKGATLEKSSSNASGLVFDNVRLGRRLAAGFVVFFVNNKAFEADYDFETDVEAKIPDYYSDLVTDINSIYGEGKSRKNYTSPYEEGDGNTLLGLSAGKIDFHTLWIDADKNTIKASVTTDMHVRLTYQNDMLFDENTAQQKAKEKSDY